MHGTSPTCCRYVSALFSCIYCDLVQLSKVIGNGKPDVLLQIELELWKVLLKVATGRDTIFPAMQAFYVNISEEQIQSVTADERAFFAASPAKSCRIERGTMPLLLLLVQSESSLSSN